MKKKSSSMLDAGDISVEVTSIDNSDSVMLKKSSLLSTEPGESTDKMSTLLRKSTTLRLSSLSMELLGKMSLLDSVIMNEDNISNTKDEPCVGSKLMKKLSSSKLDAGDISVEVTTIDNTDSVMLETSPLPSSEPGETEDEKSTLLRKSTRLGLSSLSMEVLGKMSLLDSVIMNEDNISNTKDEPCVGSKLMKKLSSSELDAGDISVEVTTIDNTDSVMLETSPLPSSEPGETEDEKSTLLRKSTRLGLSLLSMEVLGKMSLLDSVIMNEDNISNTKDEPCVGSKLMKKLSSSELDAGDISVEVTTIDNTDSLMLETSPLPSSEPGETEDEKSTLLRKSTRLGLSLLSMELLGKISLLDSVIMNEDNISNTKDEPCVGSKLMKKLSSSKLDEGDIAVEVTTIDNTDSVMLETSPLPSSEPGETEDEKSTLLRKSTRLGLSSLSMGLLGKMSLLESVIMNEDSILNTKDEL